MAATFAEILFNVVFFAFTNAALVFAFTSEEQGVRLVRKMITFLERIIERIAADDERTVGKRHLDLMVAGCSEASACIATREM